MVDTLTLIEIGLMPFIGLYIIWRHYGGWPEAWYRFRDIGHFFQIIFSPDGTPSKHCHKDEIIREQSAPVFPFQDKLWEIDPDNAARSKTGRPLYYYQFDNLHPIPIKKWNIEKWGPKLNGRLLMAAWKNNAIERMHEVGRKNPIPWFLILILIGIVVVMVAVNIYFARDVLCSIKPQAC